MVDTLIMQFQNDPYRRVSFDKIYKITFNCVLTTLHSPQEIIDEHVGVLFFLFIFEYLMDSVIPKTSSFMKDEKFDDHF